MNDAARDETDRKLKQLERKIRVYYKKSAKGIYQKWQDFMRDSAAEIAELQEAYDIAKANNDTELKKQLGIKLSRAKKRATFENDYYKAMIAEITRQLAHINATAQAYTNGMIPEFYAINYNAIAKNPQLPKMGVDFAMADAHTVKRLMLDSKITVPLRKFDEKKDIAWNTRQMNSSILQGILQGESIPKIADRIYPIVGNNENSAVRYARTMTTSAECHGRLDSYQELADRGVVLTKIWIATPDDRTRPSHIDMDGEEQNIDDEFSNGCMFPGDGDGPADEVWNCFVADTKIASDSEIVRSYKHEYTGKIISIKTARGVKFSCTPNHPIFTPRGWVAVESLNRGDDIFITQGRNNEISRRNPNINHAFPRIDTIHQFFKKFGTQRTCNLGVNFHGDIPTTNVEIITSKRFLGTNRNSGFNKFINKFLFKHSDTFTTSCGHFIKRFFRIFVSPFRFMSSSGKPLFFFRRKFRHSDIHRLRTIPLNDSNGVQTINDNRPRNSKLFRKSLNGFTRVIFADKIIDINVNFSHCDVYNLQTENGYYFVNSIIPQKGEKSNGYFAIAHNCRCSLRTHIIGYKRSDGSISRVNYQRDITLHDEQMERERARREEESDVNTNG